MVLLRTLAGIGSVGLCTTVSAATVEKFASGDFNGDGNRDVVVISNDGGFSTLEVYLSSGSGLPQQASRWATQQGQYWSAQKWLPGDFNGDGKTDLAVVFDCGNGKTCIVVHVSNGSAFAIRQQWATSQGSYWASQQWVVGDFNGDGRADLAKAFNDGGKGSVDAHLSTGSSFSMQRWATKQGSYWDDQKWVAGDFNGDGFADVAKAFAESGKTSIDVHVSSGFAFSMQRWATKQGSFWNGPQWVVGDFDGNGSSDLALLYNGQQSPWVFAVHRSSGSSFLPIANWPVAQHTYTQSQKWLAGDSTGDSLDDLVLAVADGTPDGSAGLRPNIVGGFDGPPPGNPGMCPVWHYEGYVQCSFSMGGLSGFYVPDTTEQFAPPRLLVNPIVGGYDICTPIGAVPPSYVVDMPCP